MESNLAIIDFKKENKLNPNRYGTLPPFECFISYKSKIGNPTSIAKVRLVMDGMEFGNIEIDETDDIPLEKYHLSFKLDFQQYRFNSDDNSLTIFGTSPKMNGKYEINLKVIPSN